MNAQMEMPDSTRLNLGKPVSPREIAKNQAQVYGSQPGGDPLAVPRTPVGCLQFNNPED